MKHVLIRVDASVHMGSGHLMRCLNLANALTDVGAQVTFVTRPSQIDLSTMIGGDYDLRCLKPLQDYDACHAGAYSRWLGMSEADDAAEMAPLIEQLRPDWVIVDHYGIGPLWTFAVREQGSKLLVIDDLANRSLEADILVDQGLFEHATLRYQPHLNPGCVTLLGPSYAMLKPDYRQYRLGKVLAPPKSIEDLHHIALFFGGMDVAGLTEKTLALVSSWNDLNTHWHVVSGGQCPRRHQVAEKVSGLANATHYVGLPSLAPLLAKMDACIGAGGINTYERLCLGIPTVAVPVADNQQTALLYMDRLGVQVSMPLDFDEQMLRQRMESLLSLDYPKLVSIVDGEGCERIVNRMQECDSQ